MTMVASPVMERIYVASQLRPADLPTLPQCGFKTVVDIRPDGEAAGQIPSAEIGQRLKELGMDFHYIPVPHGTIPDTAVDALGDVLSHDSQPVLLYCRTGRRAVRTLALSEASRLEGPSLDQILNMVREAGFDAEDLKDNIAGRIARRGDPATIGK